MPASARKYAGYAFTGDIPEMTPWGKAQYENDEAVLGPARRRGFNRSRQSNDRQ